MLQSSFQSQVFIVLGATDMRKAVNGLSIMVAEHLSLDLFSGNYFVFCNRGRTIIKVLYWDNNGFCLWQKRLEKHRYFWPESEQEVLEFSYRQLRWLLEGLDPVRTQAHPSLSYSTIL